MLLLPLYTCEYQARTERIFRTCIVLRNSYNQACLGASAEGVSEYGRALVSETRHIQPTWLLAAAALSTSGERTRDQRGWEFVSALAECRPSNAQLDSIPGPMASPVSLAQPVPEASVG